MDLPSPDVHLPTPDTHAPSKVHMWILILLGWTAVFSLLSVGLLLTKESEPELSSTELSAACQNGVLNGITTNLTRISEACSESGAEEPQTIPVAISSSLIPAEVTPDTQAAYIAAAFPSDAYANVAITTQALANGTLFTINHAQGVSMYFFGATTLVTISYATLDAADINTFDWSMVQ